MQDIVEKLDRLAEFQAQRDLLNADKQAAIDSVLTPEIKARLAEIDAEFADKAAAVDENIDALEAEIKADVLTRGETIKGSRLMAVWSKGRVTWDNAALQSYMLTHPEVERFRRQSEPSISIRVRSAT